MYSLTKKDEFWSGKEFEKIFDDAFNGCFMEVKSTSKLIDYKWETDTELWVFAPGLAKDDLDVDVNGSKMSLKWSNKYSSGNRVVLIPEKTVEIELDVVNGVIIAEFITQNSDISLKIK